MCPSEDVTMLHKLIFERLFDKDAGGYCFESEFYTLLHFMNNIISTSEIHKNKEDSTIGQNIFEYIKKAIKE